MLTAMSTTISPPQSGSGTRTWALLNKVPEVTIWFWIIKILCTTVGESFADWIAVDLGVGLINTTVIFTVVLAAVLTWQIRLPKYNAFSYWLTVVVLSVTGTLYTDILTDKYGVNLAITHADRRRACSPSCSASGTPRSTPCRSTASRPSPAKRSTGSPSWSPSHSAPPPATGRSSSPAGHPASPVLLPLALIAATVVGWRLGANAVLAFWIAYVLTRPLGANLGDWLAVPKELGGLNLGTAGTSVIFLAAILATVIYLAVTQARRDRERQGRRSPRPPASPRRERQMLAYFGAVAVAAVAVLARREQSTPHRLLGSGRSRRRHRSSN